MDFAVKSVAFSGVAANCVKHAAHVHMKPQMKNKRIENGGQGAGKHDKNASNIPFDAVVLMSENSTSRLRSFHECENRHQTDMVETLTLTHILHLHCTQTNG